MVGVSVALVLLAIVLVVTIHYIPKAVPLFVVHVHTHDPEANSYRVPPNSLALEDTNLIKKVFENYKNVAVTAAQHPDPVCDLFRQDLDEFINTARPGGPGRNSVRAVHQHAWSSRHEWGPLFAVRRFRAV